MVIKPPAPGAHSDFPCWDLTSDGQFSLKSTYGILYEVSLEEDPPNLFLNWFGVGRVQHGIRLFYVRWFIIVC